MTILSPPLPLILHPSVLVNGQRIFTNDDFELVEEFYRILIKDHVRWNFPVAKLLHNVRNRITDASGVGDDADCTAFLVGDCEFVEGPDASANDDDGIRGSDVDNVALHESHTSEDDDLVSGGRQILVDVLVLGEGRRDADRQSAILFCRKQRIVRKSRARTVDEDMIPLGDFSSEGGGFLAGDRILDLRTAGRTHDADLESSV